MEIGSRSFIAALVLIAIATVLAGGYLGSMPLLTAGGVVAGYALHVVALRAAIRKALTDAEEDPGAERASLEAEREELARMRRELLRKQAQAEEQWQLLRGMVRQRVSGTAGADAKGEPAADPKLQSVPDGDPSKQSAKGPGGSYGRW